MPLLHRRHHAASSAGPGAAVPLLQYTDLRVAHADPVEPAARTLDALWRFSRSSWLLCKALTAWSGRGRLAWPARLLQACCALYLAANATSVIYTNWKTQGDDKQHVMYYVLLASLELMPLLTFVCGLACLREDILGHLFARVTLLSRLSPAWHARVTREVHRMAWAVVLLVVPTIAIEALMVYSGHVWGGAPDAPLFALSFWRWTWPLDVVKLTAPIVHASVMHIFCQTAAWEFTLVASAALPREVRADDAAVVVQARPRGGGAADTCAPSPSRTVGGASGTGAFYVPPSLVSAGVAGGRERGHGANSFVAVAMGGAAAAGAAKRKAASSSHLASSVSPGAGTAAGPSPGIMGLLGQAGVLPGRVRGRSAGGSFSLDAMGADDSLVVCEGGRCRRNSDQSLQLRSSVLDLPLAFLALVLDTRTLADPAALFRGGPVVVAVRDAHARFVATEYYSPPRGTGTVAGPSAAGHRGGGGGGGGDARAECGPGVMDDVAAVLERVGRAPGLHRGRDGVSHSAGGALGIEAPSPSASPPPPAPAVAPTGEEQDGGGSADGDVAATLRVPVLHRPHAVCAPASPVLAPTEAAAPNLLQWPESSYGVDGAAVYTLSGVDFEVFRVGYLRVMAYYHDKAGRFRPFLMVVTVMSSVIFLSLVLFLVMEGLPSAELVSRRGHGWGGGGAGAAASTVSSMSGDGPHVGPAVATKGWLAVEGMEAVVLLASFLYVVHGLVLMHGEHSRIRNRFNARLPGSTQAQQVTRGVYYQFLSSGKTPMRLFGAALDKRSIAKALYVVAVSMTLLTFRTLQSTDIR